MFNQDIDVSSGYTPCPKCSLPFCSSSCLKTRCQHSAAECQIFSRSDPPVTRADLDTGVVLASLTPLRLLRLRSGDAPLYSRVNMLVDNIQEIRWSQANTDHHELNAQLLKLCTITELWNGMKTKMNQMFWCFRKTPDYEVHEKIVKFLQERCKMTEYSSDDVHRALGIFKSNSCSMSGAVSVLS